MVSQNRADLRQGINGAARSGAGVYFTDRLHGKQLLNRYDTEPVSTTSTRLD